MATVEQAPDMTIPSKLTSGSQTDIVSLTLRAIRLATGPWPAAPAAPAAPDETPSSDERVITLHEVAYHDSPDDCWVVIYDRVYDITTFLDEHPGGAEVMLEYGGRDASTAFRGSGHSRSAVRALERFLLGELPMCERIYRRPGGIKLSDMPE